MVQGFERCPTCGRGVCKKTIHFKSKALFWGKKIPIGEEKI